MSDDPRKESYYDPALTTALAIVKSLQSELATVKAENEKLRRDVTYLGNRIAQLRGISGDDAALGSQPEGSQVAPGADWPEDFAHENGNYACRCCKCGVIFTGHKRRIICKICAALPPKEGG